MTKFAISSLLLAAIAIFPGCASEPSTTEKNSAVIQSSQTAPSLVTAARAGDIDSVKEQVESGASLDTDTSAGTPLTEAAGNGHDRVVLYLLSKGADPNGTYLSFFGCPCVATSARAMDLDWTSSL